jgi:DNA-binding CsgD family transcriptional regulator
MRTGDFPTAQNGDMEPSASDDPVNVVALTPSEREVLDRARSPLTAAEIARDLSLSEATVRTHLSHIYEKLGVRGRVELLASLQATAVPLKAPIPKSSRPWIAVTAVIALALSFGLGSATRSAENLRLTVYEGNGYVGADVASFQVGETWYGFRSSVAWTDRAGTEHYGGWPDCLPRLQSVEGVRFGAAVVWHGNSGEGLILWVDCRG